MGKTLTALTILREHYREEQEHQEAMEKQRQEQQREQDDSRDDLEYRNMTPLPLKSSSIDVVEFHPEELEDISPLKPEEADELVLANILQGDDLSFLEEVEDDDSDAIAPTVPHRNTTTTHRIPSDMLVSYDKVGNKRRRLSSMDDGW